MVPAVPTATSTAAWSTGASSWGFGGWVAQSTVGAVRVQAAGREGVGVGVGVGAGVGGGVGPPGSLGLAEPPQPARARTAAEDAARKRAAREAAKKEDE
jgi:hypothetical protein